MKFFVAKHWDLKDFGMSCRALSRRMKKCSLKVRSVPAECLSLNRQVRGSGTGTVIGCGEAAKNKREDWLISKEPRRTGSC